MLVYQRVPVIIKIAVKWRDIGTSGAVKEPDVGFLQWDPKIIQPEDHDLVLNPMVVKTTVYDRI